MTAAQNPTGSPTHAVRKRAEQHVPIPPTDVLNMPVEEIGGLLSELKAQSEELKLQNEELRRLQLESESSHERLADLYDFAPVAYVIVDANGLIVDANLATAEMLRQERAKIVGSPLALCCDQDSRIKLRDHIENVLSSKTSQSCELKLTTPDGAPLDVRLFSNHLAPSGTSDDQKCRVIVTDISRHKMAESRLRESEERYRRLVESSPYSIHEIELDGTISAVNPSSLTMAGVSDESAVLGVEYLSRVSEVDRPRIGNLFDKARSGEATYFEVGSARGKVYESCFLPLTDDSGKVQRIMGIAQDISERSRIESDLLENERLFRTIFEQAAMGVAQLDSVSGVFLNVNRRYCEILGTSAEDLLGKTWMEITHSDDLAADLANMGRLRSGDVRDFAMEKRLERPDGSYIWIQLNVSPMWLPGEEPTTHIAIVQDVTRRKEAEDSLRLSEERYRSLVTATAATIWISDPKGEFSVPQPMWQAFTGQPWDEHQGFGWTKMLHPDDVDGMMSVWRIAAEHRSPYLNQGRFFHAATGEYRHCEAHATPLCHPDGSVREWFGITIDVHNRRLTETKLLEQSELTERIVLNMLDGYILTEAAGQLLDVNPAYCEMVGYSREELLAMNIQELEAMSPREAIESRIATILPTSRMRFETAHRHRDGRLIDLDVSIIALPAERAGATISIAAFVRDITERKRAEEALRESELQYRLITESAFDGIVVLEEGKIVDANYAFEQMFGYSMDELRGQTPFAIFDQESGGIAVRHIEEGTETPYELIGTKKDGTRINVEVLGRNIQRHGRPGRLTAMRDITERKRYEREQRELHDRNTSIVSAFGEIVYDWRPKTDQVIWQGDYKRILGYNSAEMGSDTASWTNRVHPDDFEAAVAEAKAARIGRRLFDVEYRFKDADGRYRWIHDRGVPFVDECGNLERIIGVFQDVTHRRAQEEELRSLNTTLEERVAERTAELADTNAELAAFARTVSHDLRAPLRAMEGFAIALVVDYGERLDECAREYIEHIVVSAKRMDLLVSELLAYSRLGRERLSITSSGLNDIVNEALSNLNADIAACHAAVEVAEQLPTVLGHRSTLVQVVMNLLSNGMKFTAKGVRPRVRVWAERKEETSIRLWVEDNGIGIDTENHDRIFRVFKRLHGIESYPGTGIGLAVVARACERLSGCCGLESQLGQGSRFWVEFPRGEAEPRNNR